MISGQETEKQILSLNVKKYTFQNQPSHLNARRRLHRCAVIPNIDKNMMTCGFYRTNNTLIWLKYWILMMEASPWQVQ